MENYENTLEQLRRHNSELKSQLQKEGILKKNLEEKIEKNDKLSDEKKTLKRNLHEKEQAATHQNKIITSLELAKKSLTKKRKINLSKKFYKMYKNLFFGVKPFSKWLFKVFYFLGSNPFFKRVSKRAP